MSNQNELWEKYSKTKDENIRKELIVSYLKLVNYIAGRINMDVGHFIEFEDLVSSGVLGLIDAIDKYKLEFNTKFETYASLRIRGAILDDLRKKDWIPRKLRTKYKEILVAREMLENEFGREPTDDEIRSTCKMTKEEYTKIISKTQGAKILSIEEFMESTGDIFSINQEKKLGNPEEEFNRLEKKETIEKALKELTQKEKYVISLYYFDDLTLKEISKVLEVTESRVSQIHTKALKKLEKKLERN